MILMNITEIIDMDCFILLKIEMFNLMDAAREMNLLSIKDIEVIRRKI